MLKNHFKIVFRKLRREKLYSFVNIFGLTIGLTTVLLIGLYVKDELSFDKFHTNKDNIYRVTGEHARFGHQSSIASDYMEIVSEDIPQITAFTRIGVTGKEALVQNGENQLNVERVYHADPNFFEFFDFGLKDATAKAVFKGDYQAVISETFKQKMFGDNDPIGAEIQINKADKFTVVAVAEKVPENSTIQFDILLHKQGHFKNDFERTYGVRNGITYVALQPEAQTTDVIAQINAGKDKPDYRIFLKEASFGLLPLTEQRLSAPYDRDMFPKNSFSYVLIFSGIGLVILLLALINYINLVTAQSINRMKEIGLRKVIGASRGQLISFQLLESIVLTTISFLLAFALAERALPAFNALLDKGISLEYFSLDFLLWVLVSGVLLGVVTGIYPAFFISRYKALSLIQKNGNEMGGKGWLRKSLVLFQFSASATLVVVLAVMMGQMNYLKEKELGYNPELLITMPLYADSTQLYETVKNQMATISGVKMVSLNGFSPGAETITSVVDGPNKQGEGAESFGLNVIFADKDFLDLMEMEVLWKSKQFDPNTFTKGQVMINSSLAKKLEWGDDATGKKLYDWNDQVGSDVVAVIADFHSKSLKEEISPLIIKPLGNWGTDQVFVRLEAEGSANTLKEMGELYETMFDRPFEYSFFDDQMASFYKKEEGQFKLFQIFSSLAVCISLLGLLALTVYMVEQRRKEVSIRKVLGASLKRLIIMLNKEYTLLIFIAFLIASPVAYYAMQDWLGAFKYQIEVSPMLFVGAFLAFLLLSWSITVFQSWKVSGENPADVLRRD